MANRWSKLVPLPLRREIKRLAFLGNARHCPICGGSFRAFRPTGVVRRDNAQCPVCGSLERHRLVWRFLEENTNFFRRTDARMLHCAAEPCLEPRFRRAVGAGYLTGDLLNPADVQMDITDIQYPDESFDIVYCSHVLEHVPDDRKAMSEFCRVLKSGGFAILLVPITAAHTDEDPSITDPQERLRRSGQHDHVRRYGPDYIDRLREAGFHVEKFEARDFLAPAEIERLALGGKMTGEIYYCTKPAAAS